MFSSHRIDVSGFDDVNLDVVKSTFSRLAAMKVWLEVVFAMSGSQSMDEQQKQVTAGTRIAALTVDKWYNSCHCSWLLACPHRVYLPLIERRTSCLVPLHSKTFSGVTCVQIGWKLWVESSLSCPSFPCAWDQVLGRNPTLDALMLHSARPLFAITPVSSTLGLLWFFSVLGLQ